MDTDQIILIIQLLLAVLLGGVIGFEREKEHKPAGLRTYILVCLGSTLFSIISRGVLDLYPNATTIDPTRIAAQVLTGIGFIGAGVILKRDEHVEGITTAAGLWVSSAIGMAIAFEYYILATITALLTWIILRFFVPPNKNHPNN